MRRFLLLAAGVAVSILVIGCSSASQNVSSNHMVDADWTEQQVQESGITCGRYFGVQSEAGIPWPIRGFDCYSSGNTPQLLVRESEDRAALFEFIRLWLAGDEGSMEAYLVDETAVVGAKPTLDRIGISQKNRVDPESSPEMEGVDLSRIECAQFASALSYSYIFDKEQLPSNLSEESVVLLERLAEQYGAISTAPPDSVEMQIELGNLLHPFNEFCLDDGALFSD